MLTLTILFVCTGLACVVLGCLQMWRKIGPNSWWGFRIPDTLADPRYWFTIHAYLGKWLTAVGSCLSLAALGLFQLYQLGFETSRWMHVMKDGDAEIIKVLVPLGITELLVFCLPLLAGCGLVLAIQTFPALFCRNNESPQNRSSPAPETKKLAA